MKKDAYYFSHDSNAKDDPKTMILIDQLGLEGYGIFWVLIETLRDQPELKYPLNLLPILARRYNTSGEKMMAVVSKYGLFEIDEEKNFFSLSLINRMIPLENAREQRRLAGIASGKARRKKMNDRSTTVQRLLNENEQSKVKESKEKKSKVKNKKERDIILSELLNIYNYYQQVKPIKDIFMTFDDYEIEQIVDHVSKYVKRHELTKQQRYLPDFYKYLSEERWKAPLPYSDLLPTEYETDEKGNLVKDKNGEFIKKPIEL